MADGARAFDKAGQGSPDADGPLREYGVGAMRFAGAPDALYERHLKFDNVVEPESADSRERYEAAARAVRDILSDRWLRTDETYARENPKRVYYISIEFLIGRSLANNVMNLMLDPVVGQTFDEHGREWWEILHEEPDAGLGNGGLGRLGRLFPRFDGDDAASGDGLWPALRARHLPAENPQRLAGGAPGQLAASSRSVGGRAPHRKRRGDLRLLVRTARGVAAHGSERAVDADRRAVRPAGGRLRRQDGQHASPLERDGRARVRLSAVQRRRFRRVDRRGAQRGIADPRPLSGRSHACRAADCGSCRNTSSSPARSPTPCAGFASRMRIGGCCRTRPPSSSTTRIRPSPCRNSCASCSTKRISAGTRRGTSRARRSPTPTTLCFPRRSSAGRSNGCRPLIPRHLEIIFEINRRLLDDIRARFPGDAGRAARVSLVEEGQMKHDPHGESGDRRLPQHQRRGGDPFRAPAQDDGARPRRGVSRTLQQQDQRGHAETLASSSPIRRLPTTISAAIGDVLDHRPCAVAKAAAAGRRRRVPRRRSQGPAGMQGALRRLGQAAYRRHRRSGHDLRLPGQAHPRIQAPAAQRAEDRHSLSASARESESRHAAAHVLLRRQGGARLSSREGHHQVHQQSGARRSTPIPRSAASSRSCSCRNTMSRSPSAASPPPTSRTRFRPPATRRAAPAT